MMGLICAAFHTIEGDAAIKCLKKPFQCDNHTEKAFYLLMIYFTIKGVNILICVNQIPCSLSSKTESCYNYYNYREISEALNNKLERRSIDALY